MPQTLDLILFDLPTYTAFVLLGAVMGLTVAYLYLRKCTRHAIQPSIFLDGALIVLASGWVGARVYHIALNWDYYAARPDQILPIETLDISTLPGGLAMRGAFIVGFFALAIYAWARHLRFAKWADASALALALGQAIGWVGAF